MKRIFYGLTLVLLLQSCISESKRTAAMKTAELWDAQESSVGSSKSADIKKGTTKTLMLTLENLLGVDAAYPNENVTSISAYSFIDNLPPNEYEDYDNITVVVKNNSSIFEKTY